MHVFVLCSLFLRVDLGLEKIFVPHFLSFYFFYLALKILQLGLHDALSPPTPASFPPESSGGPPWPGGWMTLPPATQRVGSAWFRVVTRVFFSCFCSGFFQSPSAGGISPDASRGAQSPGDLLAFFQARCNRLSLCLEAVTSDPRSLPSFCPIWLEGRGWWKFAAHVRFFAQCLIERHELWVQILNLLHWRVETGLRIDQLCFKGTYLPLHQLSLMALLVRLFFSWHWVSIKVSFSSWISKLTLPLDPLSSAHSFCFLWREGAGKQMKCSTSLELFSTSSWCVFSWTWEFFFLPCTLQLLLLFAHSPAAVLIVSDLTLSSWHSKTAQKVIHNSFANAAGPTGSKTWIAAIV